VQEVEGRLKQKVVSVAEDLSLPHALQNRVDSGGQSAPAYGDQRSSKSKQVGPLNAINYDHGSICHLSAPSLPFSLPTLSSSQAPLIMLGDPPPPLLIRRVLKLGWRE